MKITIACRSHYDFTMFKEVFDDAKFEEFEVEILHSDLFAELANNHYDLILAPGNSFGIMDGGFDAELNQRFSGNIERSIKKYIEFDELYVGNNVIVSQLNDYHILYAPTMRTPGKLHYGSINVYVAFRGAIKTAGEHNYKNIITPAFGTGFGKLHPKIAAVQMYMALRLLEEPATKWNDIYRSQRIIETGELLIP